MGKSQCGVQVAGPRFHKGVREARLNLNLVTLVDPAPQLHSSEVVEVASLAGIAVSHPAYSQSGRREGGGGASGTPKRYP